MRSAVFQLIRKRFRTASGVSPASWTIFLTILIGIVVVAGNRERLGGPRLVSTTPLMSEIGEMCQWMTPANTTTFMASGWQEETRGLGPASQGNAARTSESLIRPPLRNISDPYPTYSAVALDLANDEIVLQDENLFQIMVYDRLDNTPPSATMTEPKRIIGGHHTKIEFNCALYVDPQSGDIYSVNNDTINTMVIFSRDVQGDTPPTRELRTPHGSFGIAVDEPAEEMFLTIQHDNAVVVFDKYAKDDDPPIRLLQGAGTQLADPHGIAVDPANRLMFVGNYGNYHEKKALEDPARGGQAKANWPIRSEIPGSGRYHPPSITIYPLDASGESPPLRTIQGPRTQLNWPAHISLDQEMQELFVANDGGHSILVFDAASDGDVAPKRVIQGSRTQIKNPTGVFVDKVNNELVIANMGNHSATVFPLDASGNVRPKRIIRGGPLGRTAQQIGNPGAVGYDTRRNEILVPN